jgi:hypothetical protein
VPLSTLSALEAKVQELTKMTTRPLTQAELSAKQSKRLESYLAPGKRQGAAPAPAPTRKPKQEKVGGSGASAHEVHRAERPTLPAVPVPSVPVPSVPVPSVPVPSRRRPRGIDDVIANMDLEDLDGDIEI